jgi:multicomponent Na+:H+ antiporter subunit A
MVATLVPLQVAALVLVALGATAVVACRDVLRMVVVNGLYGLLLALLFVVYGAPDVALSMLVVTATAYPLIVLIVIGRTRARKQGEEKKGT